VELAESGGEVDWCWREFEGRGWVGVLVGWLFERSRITLLHNTIHIYILEGSGQTSDTSEILCRGSCIDSLQFG